MKNDIFNKTYKSIINESIFDTFSNYKKGVRAYKNGKFQDAHSYFLFAALDDGNRDAMFYLGQMYDEGIGVEKSDEQAFNWYRAAAVKGDIEGMYNTGICYLKGLGTEKNIDKSIKYFKQAATQGDSDAKQRLYQLKNEVEDYQRKEKEQKDKEEVQRREQMAIRAQQEKQWADYFKQQQRIKEQLKRQQQQRKRQEQQKKRKEQQAKLEKECQQDIKCAKEQWYQGDCYKAINILKQTITKTNNPIVSFLLGKMLEKSEINDDQFNYWDLYYIAAKNGYAPAMYLYAKYIYDREDGELEEDYLEAFNWYKKAARNGYTKAQSKVEELRRNYFDIDEDDD